MQRSGGPVLVTGGCGWLGSNVVRALVDEGADVTALDLPGVVEHSTEVDATLVGVDLAAPQALEQAIAVAKPSAIVHLAYALGAAAEDVQRSIAVNCHGTARVFEAALANGVDRVVWLSSSAVYGRPEPYGDAPIGEDDVQGESRLFYGICKRFNEAMAALYTRKHGLDQLGFRLALGYGPPRRTTGFSAEVSNLFEGALRETPTTLTFADAPQCWTYVDDVVSALLLGLRATDIEHRVFNVSSEEIYTPAEVGDLLMSRIPGARLEFNAVGEAEWPARLSYARAREELGYEPQVDIHTGIDRYAQSLGLAVQRPGSAGSAEATST